MIFADQTPNRIGEVDTHDMTNKLKANDEIFNVNGEIALFNIVGGTLKPVGINRFFTMLAIHERFSSKLDKELSSKVIWDHFDSMYDMAALHESEILPFPNDEMEFELPEEFDDLLSESFGIVPLRVTDENEITKNSNSLKAQKKLNASKLKQSITLTIDDKNTFLTPVSIKTTKNFVGSRSEPRPPSAENSVKVKQEPPSPAKINKIKRSSSPFSMKNGKSEPSPSIRNELTEVAKKVSKVDKNLGSTKKVPKSESVVTNNSSKKIVKQESNVGTLRQTKPETSDNFTKKIKNEKEQLSKKGKLSTPAESSKKFSRLDGKTPEFESNHRKSSDASTNKVSKSDKSSGKTVKLEVVDMPISSGSRKSSVVKVEVKDKKRKRQTEDSAKKATPIAKRRRT